MGAKRAPGPTHTAVDLGPAEGSAVVGGPVQRAKRRPRSENRPKGRPHRAERDRGLAMLASRQHGVVSIRQLEQQLGFSHQAVQRAVGAGRLHRVYRGVYAVGHANLSPHGDCLAAVLAVGPGALLSYYSAGWLWGIWRGSPKPIHVSAFVPRRHRAPQGITRHRARNWDEAERAMADGIPITSIARTILDLAWKLSADQLRRVLERAEDLGFLDLKELRMVVESNRGHPGAKRLRVALSHYGPRRFTRSEFERRFVSYLDAAGLPRAVTGWNEVGHELDVYWPERRFGVELDTYETHGSREAFERDRDRDLDFALEGIETIRVSESRFLREPDVIAAKVAELLGRRETWST